MLWLWLWPSLARKFGVWLVVRRAEGLLPSTVPSADAEAKGAVEVVWKGPKARWKGPKVCCNQTCSEQVVADAEEGAAVVSAAVTWEDEFEDVVLLTPASHRKAATFHPWELSFRVFNVLHNFVAYIG